MYYVYTQTHMCVYVHMHAHIYNKLRNDLAMLLHL